MAGFLSLWSGRAGLCGKQSRVLLSLPHVYGKVNSTPHGRFWLVEQVLGVRVRLGFTWKRPASNVSGEIGQRLDDHRAELRVVAHEFGGRAIGHPQKVVKDQDLAVRVGSG